MCPRDSPDLMALHEGCCGCRGSKQAKEQSCSEKWLEGCVRLRGNFWVATGAVQRTAGSNSIWGSCRFVFLRLLNFHLLLNLNKHPPFSEEKNCPLFHSVLFDLRTLSLVRSSEKNHYRLPPKFERTTQKGKTKGWNFLSCWWLSEG